MANLLQDVRYALKMLRHAPLFTIVAVLSLALGIGANTAIFSLIDQVMFRALPVENPEELALFGRLYPYPRYEQFRDRNEVFSGTFAVCALDQVQAGGPEYTERLSGRLVSGNYFSVLGVGAALGRTLAPEDERLATGQPVAVISHRLWKRRFGLDPSVIGRTIHLGPGRLVWGASMRREEASGLSSRPSFRPFTIVGVAPPAFSGETIGDAPDFWVPVTAQAQLMPGREWLTRPDVGWVRVVARVKPGLSIQQAEAGITVLFQQLITQEVGSKLDEKIRRFIREAKVPLLPGGRGFIREEHGKNSYASVREFFDALWILMAAAGVVLLISCANVANLLLARATGRHKEIAVRLSLGAGRARLVRQLLTESVLLALMGGVAGLLFARWGSGLLVGMASGFLSSPIAVSLEPDTRVLLFTAAVSLLTGIIFGLAPAFRGTKIDLNTALKESAATVSGAVRGLGLRRILVVAQIALSLLLLIGAALFVRSLRNQQAVDIGYNRENLVLVRIDPVTGGYRGEAIAKLAGRLRDRFGSLPGVSAVTFSENGLFSGPESAGPIAAEGHTPQSEGDMLARFDQVGPEYFRTIGIPVLLGRDIGAQDVAGSPRVAVINEAMADFYFPGTNPVGRQIFWLPGKRMPIEIVGVAGSAQDHSVRWGPTRRFYVPLEQAIEGITTVIFEVRTSAKPEALVAALRKEVEAEDPTMPVLSVQTLDQLMARSMLQEGLIARLSGFFGILALLLAAVGLYGIMSYAVARRTNEIGVRVALGAQPGNIIRMVLRETLLLALTGVAIGIPAALAAARLVSSWLFGLEATDPVTIAGAALFMIVVACGAGFVPARRAARVDPLMALRSE
jgi:predicted permease